MVSAAKLNADDVVGGKAHERKEKRAKITETLHKIPEKIRMAENGVADYRDDELLYDATTGLFIAVSRAFKGMP